MADLIQVLGALLILVPFAWQQLGSLSAATATYLWPNLAGSVVLSVLAFTDEQWGFLLLEVVWAIVAARGLVLIALGSRPAAA